MKINVRSFNDAGIAGFSGWLDNPSAALPIGLLEDDSTSEAVACACQVDCTRRFPSSYELGRYLVAEVFPEKADRFSLLADYGMWSWLSLAFIESLVRKSGGGNCPRPLAKPHYILDSPRLAYRLITRTAWDLVSLHGTAARVALGSSKSPWGEMAEQMTSRQEIYANRSFWAVADSLYALPDGSVRRGATSQRTRESRQDPKSKVGLGGVRRLPFTFRQFERTYNLRRMDSDRIRELLPAEYGRWRDPA